MNTLNVESVVGRENSNRPNLVTLPATGTFSGFAVRKSSFERDELAELKDRVVANLANDFADLGPHFIRQIVNEAVALAATTLFPELVLPVLAEEKVRHASAWAARQKVIRDQGFALAA